MGELRQAGMVIIAETILLGILPLPSVLAAIGIIPGVLPQESLLKATTDHISISHPHRSLGILATYTGFVIGQFKLAYPTSTAWQTQEK